MTALIDAARQRGLKNMNGEILTDNFNMRALVEKLGFEVHVDPDDMSVLLANRQL